MKKVDRCREQLKKLGREEWIPYLLEESGLPGRRANLELVQAVVEEGDEDLFWHLVAYDPDQAPTNSAHEFLPLCGVVGLGKLLAEGNRNVLPTLRAHASDPRWRLREGVAMALQRWGRHHTDALLREMEEWSKGNLLERRASAAALCEPGLLREKAQIEGVLQILADVTASLLGEEDRRSEAFRVLRKGLGYCWSVAVAALPEEGKKAMEKWFSSNDRDVLWIMRENLKKKRLARMDAAWVEKWQEL